MRVTEGTLTSVRGRIDTRAIDDFDLKTQAPSGSERRNPQKKGLNPVFFACDTHYIHCADGDSSYSSFASPVVS